MELKTSNLAENIRLNYLYNFYVRLKIENQSLKELIFRIFWTMG